MKTIKYALILLAILPMCACSSSDSEFGENARETPIGSVITGETNSSSEYIRRVRQKNQQMQKSSWQPESPDRL